MPLPPTPRRPKPRWQVRYRDPQGVERSGGIYTSENEANTWKRNVEKGKLPPNQPARKPRKAPAGASNDALAPAASPATLKTFGDFVERWWPTWSVLRPGSATCVLYLLNSRILPTFGTRLLPRADSAALAEWGEAIAAWKASLVQEGLRPHTVNDYVATLSKIINAAVDAELFDRNPIRRRSGSGRMPMLRNLEVEQIDVWLTIPQIHQLADAIDDRYRALIILAGRTGLRFGECAGLLWSNLELDAAYDDGAVSGVGRLTITHAMSDPARNGKPVRTRPKSRAGRRTIALDAETVEALKLHRERYGDDLGGQVFTTPGGSRGPGGTLTARNFHRVWSRAVKQTGLDTKLGFKTVTKRFKRNGKTVTQQVQVPVFTFHGLRHTHATHLIALGRPANAVAARLGHKSIAFTMEVYASVISMSEAGRLKPTDLGLATEEQPSLTLPPPEPAVVRPGVRRGPDGGRSDL